LQLANAAYLRDAFEKAGRNATLDPAIECLRVDNAVNICFRVARCRKYGSRPLRWTLLHRARWPKGLVVAVRLGENNESIRDYVLLPSVWLSFNRRMFWFSKETHRGREIERYDTFEELSRILIKRVCKETGKCLTKQARRSATHE
jgi:hypothetical protein